LRIGEVRHFIFEPAFRHLEMGDQALAIAGGHWSCERREGD
jgi:hypothetical protein